MKFNPLPLRGSYRIEIEPIHDQRGSFARICCRNELLKIGHQLEFVQVNTSYTKSAGAIRGMHFQYPPKAEIKMLKCLQGAIYDVIIDIRKGSDSFLKWHGEILSEENNQMMYIPEGFAHGFQTLQPDTALLYLHTEYYDPQYEGGIKYSDPLVGIQWPAKISDVSIRDANHPLLEVEFQGVEL